MKSIKLEDLPVYLENALAKKYSPSLQGLRHRF